MMWKRSSKCSTQSCIEVEAGTLQGAPVVAIRSTEDSSAVIYATRDEWAAFIAGAKAGEFDEPGE